MKLIATAFIMFTGYIAVGDFTVADKELQMAQVKSTCDYSRTYNAPGSEEKCGNVQDQFNMEYLCDSYAPNAKCWVESK